MGIEVESGNEKIIIINRNLNNYNMYVDLINIVGNNAIGVWEVETDLESVRSRGRGDPYWLYLARYARK